MDVYTGVRVGGCDPSRCDGCPVCQTDYFRHNDQTFGKGKNAGYFCMRLRGRK